MIIIGALELTLMIANKGSSIENLDNTDRMAEIKSTVLMVLSEGRSLLTNRLVRMRFINRRFIVFLLEFFFVDLKLGGWVPSPEIQDRSPPIVPLKASFLHAIVLETEGEIS